MGTEHEPQVVDTRSEQLDLGMFDVENATRNLETLVKYHGLEEDRLDLFDLRARIHQATEYLKAATKIVDDELAKTPGHERRGDLVVMAQNKVVDSETYRGGDSTPLRHEVAERIAEEMTATDREDVELTAHTIADGLAKVWSQPAKSKLPSKPALKKFGIDPEEWLTSETVGKTKVTVMDVELYEKVVGPPPLRPPSEIEMLSEPF